MNLTKAFYLSLGWLCVALGAIGVVLPVLPTTPFLLVAAWAFGKSSPELARRLRANKVFGPYIRDWQDHGVIPLEAKILAVSMMTLAGFSLAKFSDTPVWATALICLAMVAAGVYIVTRPSRAKKP